MIGGLPVVLLTPPLTARPPHGGAAARVDAMLRSVAIEGSPRLVIAPAGLACVDDDHGALREAEALRAVAREHSVALVFGIEVGPPEPGSGRVFACLGGSPVVWPSSSVRGFPPHAEDRVLGVGGARLLPLFAPEALDPQAPRRIAALGAIDGIVVLSHGGATARWASALARLERIAPIVVATHAGGAGRGYASPSIAARWVAVQETVDARAA